LCPFRIFERKACHSTRSKTNAFVCLPSERVFNNDEPLTRLFCTGPFLIPGDSRMRLSFISPFCQMYSCFPKSYSQYPTRKAVALLFRITLIDLSCMTSSAALNPDLPHAVRNALPLRRLCATRRKAQSRPLQPFLYSQFSGLPLFTFALISRLRKHRTANKPFYR